MLFKSIFKSFTMGRCADDR